MNKYTRKKKAKHQKYAKTKTKAKARNKAKTKKLYYGGGLISTELSNYWIPTYFTSEELNEIKDQIKKYRLEEVPASEQDDTTDLAKTKSIYKKLIEIVPQYKQKRFIPGIDSKGTHIFSNPDKYKFDIQTCATFLLFGIIANKLHMGPGPYKLIFKGGKALQLAGIDHETDDIDILLLPKLGHPYNLESISELAKNIAYLVQWILNDDEIKKQLAEISVLEPHYTNPVIYKLSWSYNERFTAIADIDFKQVDIDTIPFYSDLTKIDTTISDTTRSVLFEFPPLHLLVGEKNYVIYSHHVFNYNAQLLIDYEKITKQKIPLDTITKEKLYTLLKDDILRLGQNPIALIRKEDLFKFYDDCVTNRRGYPKNAKIISLEHYIGDTNRLIEKFNRSLISIHNSPQYQAYVQTLPPQYHPEFQEQRPPTPRIERPHSHRGQGPQTPSGKGHQTPSGKGHQTPKRQGHQPGNISARSSQSNQSRQYKTPI